MHQHNMGILAKKIGMTQLFAEDGRAIPVTLLEAGPCMVIQKKDVKTDGYNAIQIGFQTKRETLINRPEKGHFKKQNVKPVRHLKEIRLDDVAQFEVGQNISVDIFNPNEYVDVTGKSIGKGFAGVVKRHNFAGLLASHGARWPRHMGSAGAGTFPGHIRRGKKMPGRLGGKQVTTQNIKVAFVNKEKNLIYLEGSVPGKMNNVVLIRKAVKRRSIDKTKKA